MITILPGFKLLLSALDDGLKGLIGAAGFLVLLWFWDLAKKWYRNINYSREVKILNYEIEKLWEDYESDGYSLGVQILKPLFKKSIRKNHSNLTHEIKNGFKPNILAIKAIGSTAGNLLESGKYHIYRGVLNPLTGGNDLHEIYMNTLDRLVVLGEITQEDCDENKALMHDNIKSVG